MHAVQQFHAESAVCGFTGVKLRFCVVEMQRIAPCAAVHVQQKRAMPIESMLIKKLTVRITPLSIKHLLS
jgi:hypothetical protein